jgi:hypothetical protein
VKPLRDESNAHVEDIQAALQDFNGDDQSTWSHTADQIAEADMAIVAAGDKLAASSRHPSCWEPRCTRFASIRTRSTRIL